MPSESSDPSGKSSRSRGNRASGWQAFFLRAVFWIAGVALAGLASVLIIVGVALAVA